MVKVLIPLIISLTALIIVLYLLFGRRQKKWDELSPKEKKRKKVMIFSGLAVFLAGIIAALSVGRKDKPDSD